MEQVGKLLQKHSNELATPDKLSPTDLALIVMLDTASQIYGRELLPEEPKAWREQLKGQLPQKIQQAFDEHMGRSAFFPKPSEILTLISELDAEKWKGTYVPVDRAATAAHQETPEWEAEAQKAREALRKAAGL